MPNVTLGAFATVPIAAASGVYRLGWPSGGTRTVDLMNVGAGSVFIRADSTNPTVNDPGSLQLPANWAINKLTVDGSIGLGVIAGADTTISVRIS